MLHDATTREQFFAQAGAHVDFVVAEFDGMVVLVSTEDSSPDRGLFVTRGRAQLGALDRAVAALRSAGQWSPCRRSTFLDLGAGAGVRTIASVRVHGVSKVVACEQLAVRAARLRATAMLNDLGSRVHVVHARAGTGISEGATGAEPILALSVDDLARRGLFVANDVVLLWIDGSVRGAADVLQGSTCLTSHAPPVVLDIGSAPDAGALLALAPHTHMVNLGAGGETAYPLPIGDGAHRVAGPLLLMTATRRQRDVESASRLPRRD